MIDLIDLGYHQYQPWCSSYSIQASKWCCSSIPATSLGQAIPLTRCNDHWPKAAKDASSRSRLGEIRVSSWLSLKSSENGPWHHDLRYWKPWWLRDPHFFLQSPPAGNPWKRHGSGSWIGRNGHLAETADCSDGLPMETLSANTL